MTSNSSSPNDDWGFDNSSSLNNCIKCAELSSHVTCRCLDNPLIALNTGQHLPELTLNLVTYILCIIFGVFWNLFTLLVMIKGDRKNRNVTNVFLISLAVADLLLVSIAAPMELIHYFAPQFGSGGSGCKIAEYSRVLSAVASILNLLSVTLERFIVIVFPMRSRSLCTMSNSRRALGVVWGLSMVLTLPVVLTKSVYDVYYANNITIVKVTYCNDYDDSLGLAFSIYQLVVVFIIPGIVIIICYSVVIRELWKSTKRMAVMTNVKSEANVRKSFVQQMSNKNKGNRASRNLTVIHRKCEDVGAQRKQVIKMLVCVVVLFFLCWGPRFIMEIIIKSKTQNLFYPTVYWIRVILFLLPFVHACFNPIIYIFMSKTFRSSLLKLSKQQCVFKCTSAQMATPQDENEGEEELELQLGAQHPAASSTTLIRSTKVDIITSKFHNQQDSPHKFDRSHFV